MKYIIILLLSACSNFDSELQAHLETERDFHAHQHHVQQLIEKGYDLEYIDDCYYYETLICDFEH